MLPGCLVVVNVWFTVGLLLGLCVPCFVSLCVSLPGVKHCRIPQGIHCHGQHQSSVERRVQSSLSRYIVAFCQVFCPTLLVNSTPSHQLTPPHNDSMMWSMLHYLSTPTYHHVMCCPMPTTGLYVCVRIAQQCPRGH